MKFISSLQPPHALFGIANVESGRCSYTIGYFLGPNILVLLMPRTCASCPNARRCSRTFGAQIVDKYNQRHTETQLRLNINDE